MKRLALAALILSLSPAAAVAEVKTTVNTRGSGQPDSVVTRLKDGRICKSTKVTGSRLGARKICRTEKEWSDQAAITRQMVERGQVGAWRFIPGGAGGS